MMPVQVLEVSVRTHRSTDNQVPGIHRFVAIQPRTKNNVLQLPIKFCPDLLWSTGGLVAVKALTHRRQALVVICNLILYPKAV
jgi:hypothetical protein